VGRQLAHLQNVRIYQLTSRAKTLAPDTRKFATAEEPDHATLRQALDDTAARIENWLSMVHNGEKGARPMPGGLVTTLAYLISHESPHRGSIVLTLKQGGEPIAKASREELSGHWGKSPDDRFLHHGFSSTLTPTVWPTRIRSQATRG
jgi:uncharacterized damage-inducible protein DinB